MNDAKVEEPRIELEYELDAPPHKVWRAISLPAFRETWLPSEDLADPEPMIAAAGKEVRYRMRDSAPPFVESAVTFQIAPNANGGTRLRIIHVTCVAAPRASAAANDNGAPVALVA
jgi:uncharacterized protein YndB with AHSA1/START domain